MKYVCQNCNYCCITVSPQVQFCGSRSDCNNQSISYAMTVGMCFLVIFLNALALFLLYYSFKDRKVGV